jgi:hypothetical protein
MTPQPTGHVMWTPDPIKQRPAAPFGSRPAIVDITP